MWLDRSIHACTLRKKKNKSNRRSVQHMHTSLFHVFATNTPNRHILGKCVARSQCACVHTQVFTTWLDRSAHACTLRTKLNKSNRRSVQHMHTSLFQVFVAKTWRFSTLESPWKLRIDTVSLFFRLFNNFRWVLFWFDFWAIVSIFAAVWSICVSIRLSVFWFLFWKSVFFCESVIFCVPFFGKSKRESAKKSTCTLRVKIEN